MKNTAQQVSVQDRVQHEKEMYDIGLDRKKYNSTFGHAQGGYSVARKNALYASVLQSEKGKDILELGSLSWRKYIDFQNCPPAKLTCINISESATQKGRRLANKRGTSEYAEHVFEVMDAHHLDFPDNSFDIVFGQEILHHLDLEAATPEMARVLKPGGQIVFSEPLERNPVGRLVRKMTPDKRTAFEKPLNKQELDILRRSFDLDLSYHQLLYVPAGMLSKYLFKSPQNPLMLAAHKTDLFLEKLFKRTSFGLYFRQIVIIGTVRKA